MLNQLIRTGLAAGSVALTAGSALLAAEAPTATVPTFEATTNRMTRIGKGYATTGVNVAIFRMSSLVSFENTQYAAFYDESGRMVLAKRQLGAETWETQVSPYSGHVRDAHNSISLGVDGKGVLHVSWDHHNNPLNYCRSVAPGSLQLTERLAMTGRESSVCYPQFYPLPGGDLLFLYRTGGSGRGDLMMSRYDVRNGRWVEVPCPKVIDGEGQRNAYWQTAVNAQNGVIHLTWCWREAKGNVGVESNHDICYARSEDGGRTWLRSNGVAYAMPITVGNAEVVAPVPQRSCLMNMTSMALDSRGRPFTANYWRPAGAAIEQMFLVYYDGMKWQTRRITDRTSHPVDVTKSGGISLSRPLVLLDRWDRAYVVFRDAARGSMITLAASADADYKEWTLRDLTAESVGDWEPTHDPMLWNRKNQLHLLVQKCRDHWMIRPGPDAPAEPVSVLEWLPPAPSDGAPGIKRQ